MVDITLNELKKLMMQEKLIHKKILVEKEKRNKVASDKSERLKELYEKIKDCKKCRLWENRINLVFGDGSPDSGIVFIGEAPGKSENREGRPFVGDAGRYLNKLLEEINLKREDIYITNVVKCWPPGDRDPLPDEIEKCRPYLEEQLKIIEPKIIVCLGRFAGWQMLGMKLPMMKMRGRLHNKGNYKVLVTFHPAAILYHRNWEPYIKEDFRILKKFIEDEKLL